MSNCKKLIVQPVTAENFSKLGKVLRIPVEGEMKPLLESSFFKHYGPLGFIDCEGPVEFGITTFQKRELIVDKLEQHAKTPELLYAIDGGFIMPVAPIILKDGAAYPDLEQIIAIHVKQGEGILFDDGIWHWAPYPYDKNSSSVLVCFKKGTAEDDIVIRGLEEKYLIIVGG